MRKRWQKMKGRNYRHAQVYVFTAVLVAAVMLGIVSLNSAVLYKGDSFKPVVENYRDELYYVVNNAVYSGSNPEIAVKDYTEDFIWYASQRNLDVSVMIMVYNETTLTLINRYDGDVGFERTGYEFIIKEGNMNMTEKYDDIKLHSGDNIYTFDISGTGVKALVKREYGENVQIYKV